LLLYIAKTIHFDAIKLPLIGIVLGCDVSVVLTVYESGLLMTLHCNLSTAIIHMYAFDRVVSYRIPLTLS